MRRYATIVGIMTLFAPMTAKAVDCAPFENAPAISQHYVQKVIDRATAGIERAKEARSANDFFPLYFHGWARSIGGTLSQIIDSRQALTERTNDLESATACLRYDQLLLECTMEKVQRELDVQLERGSFFGIMQLQSILLFLHDRYAQLSLGAQDATYADATWKTQRLFDDEAPPNPDVPLCPFHSDYTPPRLTGYGCDVSVLRPIVFNTSAGMPSAEAELQALTTIEEEIDSFLSIAPLLQSATNSVGIAQNVPMSQRTHKTIVGCQETQGVCSDDASYVCGSDEFCASKNKGTCLLDATSPTIPKRERRGPFSYATNHLALLKQFMEKRIEDGLSRTFPPQWSRTEDLPANDDDANPRANDDPLMTSARTGLRIYFRSVSGIQGRNEGSIFPEATDAQLEIAESLSDMRAAIGELSRLASKPSGVRAFVVDLAYFLRRTCAFRPCQRSLEQLIRIGLADECFPYTNGEFLQDSENSPRWKKCATAACIQVDGVELSDQCRQNLP